MLLRLIWVLALASILHAVPLRVLLVTGGHAYDNSFHSVFEQPDADWVVTVDPHPGAFSGDIRERYDVVVLYDMVEETDEERRANLRDFAEADKGLVILHHAILDDQSWPWFESMAGGKYLREAEDEHPASTFQHDVKMRVEVKAEHPVVEGIEDFEIEDEVYGRMRISDRNLVLLETSHPASSGPVAWISPFTKSRVCYIQLGHSPAAHRDRNFRKLVRQAVEWAGGR